MENQLEIFRQSYPTYNTEYEFAATKSGTKINPQVFALDKTNWVWRYSY